MWEVLRSEILLILYLAIFVVWGNLLKHTLKWKMNQLQCLIFGFLLYFSVFQLMAFPMIIAKTSLTVLTYSWGILTVLVTIWGLCLMLKHGTKGALQASAKGLVQLKHKWIYIVLGCFVALQIIVVTFQAYSGWDTAFYVGTMNTSLFTDTMYIYDGNSGRIKSVIDMRYAMSTFFMQFTVGCKVFNIHPQIMTMYLVRQLCVLLADGVVYLIASLFFKEKKSKVFFVICFIVLNFFWISEYAPAKFLMVRGYEAKGFCANIVIPMILYCGILLYYKGQQNRQMWQMLFLVGLSSVPLSMSSILIVPVMIAIMGLVDLVFNRKWKNLLYDFVCVLPNLIYLILFFLYTKEIWRIGVK